MTDRSQETKRRGVLQTLDLLGREIRHFTRTQKRLFGQGEISPAWVQGMEEYPAREDMVESFAAKFNRIQDTMGDKLLPRLFHWLGENPAPFLDNLHRAEKLGFIQSADNWMKARRLRNKLIHEYVEDPGEFAGALNLANRLAGEMLEAFSCISNYVEQHKA